MAAKSGGEKKTPHNFVVKRQQRQTYQQNFVLLCGACCWCSPSFDSNSNSHCCWLLRFHSTLLFGSLSTSTRPIALHCCCSAQLCSLLFAVLCCSLCYATHRYVHFQSLLSCFRFMFIVRPRHKRRLYVAFKLLLHCIRKFQCLPAFYTRFLLRRRLSPSCTIPVPVRRCLPTLNSSELVVSGLCWFSCAASSSSVSFLKHNKFPVSS